MRKIFENRKVLIGILIGLILVVLLGVGIAASLIFRSLGRDTVDLEAYYSISVSGLNGYAKSSVVFDGYVDESLFSGISSVDEFVYAESLDSFIRSIAFDLNKETEISNGDKITATASYDKETADKLNVRVKNTVLKLTVKDLEEGGMLDLFDGLEVVFEHVAPFGTAEVFNNNPDAFIRTVSYTVQPASGLKNGDIVEVVAEYDENSATSQGYIVQDDRKEFVVNGLDEYIRDDTALTQEQLEAIEKEAMDLFESKAADSSSIFRDYSEEYLNINEVLSYTPSLDQQVLLTLKTVESPSAYSSEPYNKVVCIYQCTAKLGLGIFSTKEEKTLTGYSAVILQNVYFDADGNLFYELPNSWSSSGTMVHSYDLDKVMDKAVTVNKADYIVTEYH